MTEPTMAAEHFWAIGAGTLVTLACAPFEVGLVRQGISGKWRDLASSLSDPSLWMLLLMGVAAPVLATWGVTNLRRRWRVIGVSDVWYRTNRAVWQPLTYCARDGACWDSRTGALVERATVQRQVAAGMRQPVALYLDPAASWEHAGAPAVQMGAGGSPADEGAACPRCTTRHAPLSLDEAVRARRLWAGINPDEGTVDLAPWRSDAATRTRALRDSVVYLTSGLVILIFGALMALSGERWVATPALAGAVSALLGTS